LEGYDISECTWELASNLQNAPKKVVSFYKKYPQKPKLAPFGTHH